MEFRPLEVKLISAKGLKNVNVFTKMDVYAVVSINGDHRTSQKTPVDKDCGPNPQWNYTVKFTVDEAAARHNRLNLVFRLKSDRQLGDIDIGEVQVPIKELLDHHRDKEKAAEEHVSYSVRTPSGKAKGTLYFSYKFGEKFEKQVPQPPLPAAGAMHVGKHDQINHPAMAYPPPPTMHVGKHGESQPVMAYPPPPAGYPAGPSSGHPTPPPPPQGAYPPPPPQHGMPGYPYPPHGGYAYPHAPPHAAAAAPGYGYGGYPGQGGYGFPPVQKPQKPKKGGMGAGLGLGLAGGLLGGMLIGDMVGDAYEAGFDDAVDFDF